MQAHKRDDGKFEIFLGNVTHVINPAQAEELAKSILKCQWKEFDIFEGDLAWETGCGETYCYDGFDPRENGVKYCQHCGRKINFIFAEGK